MRQPWIPDKKLQFLTEDSRKDIYTEIESKVAEIRLQFQQEVVIVDDTAAATTSQLQPVSNEEDLFFSNSTVIGEATQTETIKTDLQQYLDLPPADIRTDPLKWWSDHQNQFMCLSKVAQQYLCIPATSVASERDFSTAGRTVTKIRNPQVQT